MKKRIALFLAALMLCTVFGGLAEEQLPAPLYATVGDAMEACPEDRVIAGAIPDEYIAVVTEKDGKYYRNVAYWDEKMKELNEALDQLDYEAEDFFEKHDAAMQAVDDYQKTLPIAYSEEFTALPLSDEEIGSMRGKTLSQLTEEGFEIGSSFTESDENEEMIIVYWLRYGVFDYSCIMDADFDQLEAARDNGTEGDLVVRDASLLGITEWAFDKRFHTDGTVDQPEDPFAEFSEILSEIMNFLETAQTGEEIDFAAFADTLKANHPDYADMIDLYLELYKTYGAEGFASMMNAAE